MVRWIISILISISIAMFNAMVHTQGNMPLGTLSAPNDVTVVVVNKSGEQITIQPPETTIQLPAGEYRIESWTMERTDDAGNVWKLTGKYFSNSGIFNIIKDEELKLSIGEPIIPSLSVKESDSRYCFDFYLRGQRSEIVEITKNGGRPDAPELHITNADGSYRETLTFAYG